VPDDEAGSQPTPSINEILTDEYLVDAIFPTRRLHIVSGPVGAGKTTLEFQMTRCVLDSAPFLDYATHNSEGVVFISADRSRRETHATLRRMDMLDLAPRIKWVFMQELPGDLMPNLELMIGQHTRPGQMVIVEPLGYFLRDGQGRMGNPNDYGQVSHFLKKVKAAIERHNVTVISSLHPSKVKGGDTYAAMREKLLGSTAWAGFTDTILFIEPTEPDDPNSPYRRLHVLPRNTRAFTLEYMQDPEHGGLFVPVEMAKPMKNKLDLAIEAYTEEFFSSEDLEQWSVDANISRATAWRWLEQKVRDGIIERVGRGSYRLPGKVPKQK